MSKHLVVLFPKGRPAELLKHISHGEVEILKRMNVELVIDPPLTGLNGHPPKYWKLEAYGKIVPMTVSERLAVDKSMLPKASKLKLWVNKIIRGMK